MPCRRLDPGQTYCLDDPRTNGRDRTTNMLLQARLLSLQHRDPSRTQSNRQELLFRTPIDTIDTLPSPR